MTKSEMLEIIKLLSAIEIWAFMPKNGLPEFLHENLANTIDRLSREVLRHD